MGRSKHFHQGDIIYYNRKPFVFALCSDQRLLRCDHCFIKIPNEKPRSLSPIICLNCRYVRYCSHKCQNESIELHQTECPIIGHRPLRTMTRLILRALVKIHSNNAFKSKSFSDMIYGHERTWNCLIDHHDQIIRNVDAMLTFGLVIEELELVYKFNNNHSSYSSITFNNLIDLDIERLSHIYGKILINSFAISEPDTGLVLGRALYLGASIFDHSCRPDLYYQFDGLQIYFIAARDIHLKPKQENMNEYTMDDDGEDICQLYIAYIDEMMPVQERQCILRSSYYFDCKCSRCCEDLLFQQRRLSDATVIYPRLSHCLDMVEDYFHSDHVYNIIRFAVDYYDNKVGNQKSLPKSKDYTIKQLQTSIHNPSYQRILDECQTLLLMSNGLGGTSMDIASMIRIKDFIACQHQDPGEIENLYRAYSEYYGNRKHPRLLQKIWYWLGLLLLIENDESKTGQKRQELLSNVSRSLYRQSKMIRTYLRYDSDRMLQTFK